MVEDFHAHVERGVAAQAGGQAGDVRGPVAGVRDDDDVGVEFVAMRFDERNEAARAHFLFAFEEHFDVDVQVIAERLERARMDGYAAAVVARAAPVEAVAHLGGGEGVVDVPVRRIRGGLHIMVRVQEHGGRFRVDDMRADDLPCARGAVRVGGLFDMRVDTDLAHFAGDEFSRTLHMLAGDTLRGHGFERDLLFEQVDDPGPVGFYARADGLFIQRGHGFSLYIWSSCVRWVMCRRRAPSAYRITVIPCRPAVPIGPVFGGSGRIAGLRASSGHRNLQA